MRIGESVAQTGVSARSLRYYEQQGLLVSTRSASGQRHYKTDVVERVEFIRRMFAAGLSSRTMAELLPFIDAPTEENYDFALERMIHERDRLNDHIADLIRTRDSLDELMATNRAHRKKRWPKSRGPRSSPISGTAVSQAPESATAEPGA